MGNPAARIGDLTAHGGVITLGEPTVLIGGMPAARVGDMHTCPMCDGPKPHVGGPITMGCFVVLIGNRPAARVGDMVTCVGPPDTITMGCFTVLIGEGGGAGGGAGSGGSGSGQGAGQTAAAAETNVGSGAGGSSGGSGESEDHYLDVKFVDRGGHPITDVSYSVKKSGADVGGGALAGDVKMNGVDPGTYDIELKAIKTAKWSVAKAAVGDTVKLTAESFGIAAGTDASFRIFQIGSRQGERLVETISDCQVAGDKVEAQWKFDYSDDDKPEIGHENAKEYSYPRFYFSVTVAAVTARSDLLTLSDELQITLKDDKGNAIPDEQYVVQFTNGEMRQGKLDANGTATERNVPPAKCRVTFPNVTDAKKLPT